MQDNFDRWGAARFSVLNDGSPPLTITVKGRDRWALEMLMQAGAKGCTPITRPAPRWSAYVFKLRAQGVRIETIHETHGGPFAGNHARYILRSAATMLPANGEAVA